MKLSATRAAGAMCLAVFLASCGSGSEHDDADATATAAGGITMPSDWKATDACSILDKAVVADALKVELTETQLNLVNEPDALNAGSSECSYLDGTGSAAATLLTRWSPTKDNSAGAITAARQAAASALKAMSDEPLEDIPDLGKAAFFVPGINQLQVFIDDSRMVIITPGRVPDGATGKDVAIALARKVGA
jgi:hypothetical protein